MNDTHKIVKTKEKEYTLRKTTKDNITYDIKIIKDQEIKFKKDAKVGDESENLVKIKYRKHETGDKNEIGKELDAEVKVQYDGGVLSEGFKFKKFNTGTEEVELKDELSPGVKGFKVVGHIVV
jgi:hypothetical protein